MQWRQTAHRNLSGSERDGVSDPNDRMVVAHDALLLEVDGATIGEQLERLLTHRSSSISSAPGVAKVGNTLAEGNASTIAGECHYERGRC